jgi:hypothetical protein
MALPVIQVNTDSQRLIEYLRKYPDRLAKAIMPAVREASERLASAVAETQFGPQGELDVRTGKLRASVAAQVITIGGVIAAKIGVLKGPATAYARILEEGGTISAKAGKALAIPVGEALTPSGRPRYPGGPREAEPRQPNEVFMIAPTAGPPLIVRRRTVRGSGTGARIKETSVLFVLQKSVVIPKKLWLSQGVLRNWQVWEVTFNERVRREMESTGG